MLLILASGSPRRLELLSRLITNFEAAPSPVEDLGSELWPPEPLTPLALPRPFFVPLEADPRLWAWRKAVDVAETNRAGLPTGSLVLGADTVVVGPTRLFGKPTSPEDAARMLDLLRGRDHYVVTGFVVIRTLRDGIETQARGAVFSRVVMRDFSVFELEGYVVTGEPMDKAGAYALQGLGGSLVERVEGCRTNVVGLPLCAVRDALQANKADLLPYPEGGYCDHCLAMSPDRTE